MDARQRTAAEKITGARQTGRRPAIIHPATRNALWTAPLAIPRPRSWTAPPEMPIARPAPRRASDASAARMPARWSRRTRGVRFGSNGTVSRSIDGGLVVLCTRGRRFERLDEERDD